MLSVIAQPACARHGGLEYTGAGLQRAPRWRRARSARGVFTAARACRGARPGHRGGVTQGGARAGRAGCDCRGSRSAARARARYDPRHVVAGGDGDRRSGAAGAAYRDGFWLAGRCRTRAGAIRSATISPPMPRRAELHTAMLRFHERYDLLLTPTMPVTALKVGRLVPDGGDFGDDWINWSPYTYPFNLTQQPAASVPVGLGREWPADGRCRSSGRCGPMTWCCGRRGQSSERCRCREHRTSCRNFCRYISVLTSTAPAINPIS